MECAIKAGDEALEDTVNQNPVLKKAGVVDAGGKGFMVILSAMLAAFRGEMSSDSAEGGERDYSESNAITTIGFEAFCNCNHLRSVILGNHATTIYNGAFSYCIGHPAPYSQGQPVCVPNLPESDVNANSLAQGARTMTLKALGIVNAPLFGKADAKRFFERCGESFS